MDYAKIELKKGDVYGRWTVEEEIGPLWEGGYKGKTRMVMAYHDCGTPRYVKLKDLVNNKAECYKCKKYSNIDFTNMDAKVLKCLRTKLQGMKFRCNNPNSSKYKWYGGKGVTVCEEWSKDTDSFIKWSVVNGFKPGLEIDRKNPALGYTPDNCRFVDHAVNCQHQTSTKLNPDKVRSIRRRYSKGISLTDIAKEFGVWPNTIKNIVDNISWTNVQ